METKEAFLSVYDKTGLVDFASVLVEAGYQLVSSGGTGTTLREAGFDVTTVEDLTGLPSILGGRVKTFHPAIHGGILAKETEEDRKTLEERGWGYIDVVAVNLYPFVETVSKPETTEAEAIEQIDIGGVALIRAAAKNFNRVTVITSPGDYEQVGAEISDNGTTSQKTRRALALKAFGVTASYDAAISQYFTEQAPLDAMPATISITVPQAQVMRYGENPHQMAAYYAPEGVGPLGGELLQGKALSYNNLLDIDAAWSAAEDFEEPTVVIVKHLSPTGIASHSVLAAAFKHALASDPISAFGGVIACNRTFDDETAEALEDMFVEAVVAPGFTDGAAKLMLEKRKNCRLLKMHPLSEPRFRLRSVRGGLLAQSPDEGAQPSWDTVTERHPTEDENTALRFAWKVVKYVKSNAIVLAKGSSTVGIGGGLPSRVDAAELAAIKAGDEAQGAVIASDAFFPFPDGLEAAVSKGVTAVIQPGGSIRDEQVIDAANRLGIAMIFTGVRHFRH